MALSLWDLRLSERVTLYSGAVAEVVAPTEDGTWILVKYLDAPESPEIVGKPESTERRLWGQSLKKPEGAPLNLG